MTRATAAALAALVLTGAGEAMAQNRNGSAIEIPATVRATAPPEVPFKPGERLTYQLKYGFASVGEGHMTVHGIEDVRGADTYHVSMDLDGSALFGTLKVKDRFHSWFDIRSLASRRFIKDQQEVNYTTYREYEIYPEERRWERTDPYDDKTGESVSDLPLDDIAFVYFIRTLPLEVGKTYTFDRYFKEDGNPVTLKVLRREIKEVPAGRFQCIVVQPLIKTSGLFAEGGEAELYFSDDEDRQLIYMRTKLGPASVSLHLKSIEGARMPPSRRGG